MASTTEFTVIGEQKIHCEGCEQRIGNALRRLPGVEDVKASYRTQRVQVKLNPEQVGPEQVQDRLDLLGYRVEPHGKGA